MPMLYSLSFFVYIVSDTPNF